MDYFAILNLKKEPFSNSPDPEFFFQSQQHLGCLQKLELSLRLRRGLNVVLGDVGTGKTTLCRQLIRRFADDPAYATHLILDPQFSSPSEFLGAVAEMFEGRLPAEASNDWQFKEIIKKYIFGKGVAENKTVVLIIDEGQKIPEFCLEILREFLNFETNTYKLLQIVIFAQKEFEKTLQTHANFADRINLYHVLGPMSFCDTRLMIRYRLEQSSGGSKTIGLFSYPALWAIYRASRGYPRKIINLCHRSILTMIIQNRTRVGWLLVRSCAQRSLSPPLQRWSRVSVAVLIGLALVALTAVLMPESRGKLAAWKPEALKTTRVLIQPPQSDPARTHLSANPELQQRAHSLQLAAGNASESENDRIPYSRRFPAASSGELQNLQQQAGQSAQMPVDKPALKGQSGESADTGLKKVLDTTAEASVKKADVEIRLPSALGQVALKRNETLWNLIKKVYGVDNSGVITSQYLQSVIDANHHIVDPDHIKAGRPLLLPAIPATVTPLPKDVWWLEIQKQDRLEAAIDVLRKYPYNALPIHIIPYWNRQEGLKFAILLKGFFFDEASARDQLSRLPSELAPEGRILSRWDQDTVFYSDPFAR